MKKRLLLFIGGLVVVTLFWNASAISVLAQSVSPSPSPTATPGPDLTDINRRIAELQAKLDEVRKEKNSLSTEIRFLDNKILLNEKEIEKTELEIRITVSEIEDLAERISGLKTTLTQLSENLISRVQTQYKQKASDPISRMFATTGIADFLKEDKYREKVRVHTQDLLITTEEKRQNYNEEKTVKEEKQKELEALERRLASQRGELDQQKAAKRKLLDQTNNSEQNYQRLLAEAQAELSSLSRFTSGRGATLLPPQNSPDGWYFSQRDERWGSNCVGTACNYSVLEVGCLVSSAAMVKKKFGENVTPAHIAANPSHFFGSTAFMLRPYPAPSGYRYAYSRYNANTIDNQLEQGRPVIVKLSVSSQYSTHFVVIKDGRNGDYIMHDPWEGYDKKFKDFYSLGQIIEIAYLVNS